MPGYFPSHGGKLPRGPLSKKREKKIMFPGTVPIFYFDSKLVKDIIIILNYIIWYSAKKIYHTVVDMQGSRSTHFGFTYCILYIPGRDQFSYGIFDTVHDYIL
jgi:hypothetical protein